MITLPKFAFILFLSIFFGLTGSLQAQTPTVNNISKSTTHTFNYTGAVQTFVVPEGVRSIDVDAYGGKGGWGNYKAGGNGGRVEATLNVRPGQTLNIYVGGQGQGYDGARLRINKGGWNGGGSAHYNHIGAGGGATDIRIGGTALANRVIVAGAGGGSGGSDCPGGALYKGAKGGGLVGGAGGACKDAAASQIGQGGTQAAGGARGCRYDSSYCGTNGELGVGGQGVNNDGGNFGGSGGGGFYGGGGGGGNNDGGGGSSYTDPILCTNVVHTQGVREGDGLLIITVN